MRPGIRQLIQFIAGPLRDISPVILVIAFFQLVVLRQPLPNLEALAIGLVVRLGELGRVDAVAELSAAITE